MSEHITSPATYYSVFGGLIALTLLTVGVSFVDLGPWHIIVGLVIGAAKAALVVLFFMQLLHAPRLNWLVIGCGLFWLGILIVLSLADYLTRHWLAF